MNNEDKRWQKWEQTRQMGRNRFILFYGVFGWGVLTALLSTLWMYFLIRDDVLILFVTSIILFPIGGYFWGYYMWRLSEKKYRQYLEKRGSN